MPGFWDVIAWILRGLLQYTLFWIPVVKPFPEDGLPPWPWWFYNNWGDWFWHRDSENRPDEHFIRQWLEMAFGELKRLTLYEANQALDQARIFLRDLIGYVRADFPSLGSWVNSLADRLGDWLPDWAGNVGWGLNHLMGLFPAWIKYGWGSWGDLWENIRQSVRDWAMGRYDAFRAWAGDAIDWVRHQGYTLRSWWDRAHSWLDWFRGDPYGAIASFLGAGWQWLLGFWYRWRDEVLGLLGWDYARLVLFSQTCLSFYYNLWSVGWSTLDAFVRDPGGFVIDRLEGAIMTRW